MGYQVYRDIEGHDRWAGYGVPAECDMQGCTAPINHGLGYKCEDGHGEEPDSEYDLEGNKLTEDDPEFEDYGCGLYFCEAHMSDTGEHAGVVPKPDSKEWVQHMLTDESWEEWRTENADLLPAMRERAAA